MDQNNQVPVSNPAPAPATNPAPMTVTPPQSERKVGPIVASLIIVIIIIIAALYLFASKVNQPAPVENSLATQPTPAAAANAATPDDLSGLEAELNATTDGLNEQNF